MKYWSLPLLALVLLSFALKASASKRQRKASSYRTGYGGGGLGGILKGGFGGGGIGGIGGLAGGLGVVGGAIGALGGALEIGKGLGK